MFYHVFILSYIRIFLCVLCIKNKYRSMLFMHIALLVNLADYQAKKLSVSQKKHVPKDAFVELDAKENVDAYKYALESEGHVVSVNEGDETLIPFLLKSRPDFCFNTCEGFIGESREAHVPAILEMLNIPYSGPSPLAAALTQDKPTTKKILLFHKILTPKFQTFVTSKDALLEKFTYPLFVKPSHEGTGMGIKNDSIVRNEQELRKQVKKCIHMYHQPALVEEYIVGRDITCGIIGNGNNIHFPPITEIDYSGYRKSLEPIYGVLQKVDFAHEYKNKCPAPLSKTMEKKVHDITKKVFEVTGCRDFGRVDFRLTKGGNLYVLEINGLPGITLHSDLSLMAYAQGWSHKDLILSIFHASIKRLGIKNS